MTTKEFEVDLQPLDVQSLRQELAIFSIAGERVLENEPLARHTAARLGGPADAFLEVQSSQELRDVVQMCWRYNRPFLVLGGGSNVLVSDSGVRGLVILNRARQVRFSERLSGLVSGPDEELPGVWVESGANFGLLARQAAQRGLAGLEWAAGIPGTVGGAVVGNAGAHGGDMAGNLLLAEILQRGNTQHSSALLQGGAAGAGESYRQGESQEWPAEKMEFAYRSSILKRDVGSASVSPAHPAPSMLILSALLRLERSTPQAVQARIDEFVAYRKRTQPPGASMGSMFKNPAGDYAGRLIEAAGLKGLQIGGAQISPVHANFFVNQEGAAAADIYQLIQRARQTVADRFGVQLELEVELIGEW